ncbi:metal ABC transporter substrate-binding protein [Ruminiclostridium cellobioparum]|uniref:ABC-type metal ion transport system, periplasmic component/surface adhesin n=1 Tax=Ruminiclostridium cellobioparum subsp. termitidis CT1112 TaxID=1195236 RepID=S0FLB4_RUMCE|nr:metal ABC transporter substrate-binding protein [Ruminiclostridium cellobioparum]EMS72687.1 ABC-type metal ion transport system, periplasmic component/surface adhesin [Ruminiclostridium cellobioparum subsp. termitidis CT1112]
MLKRWAAMLLCLITVVSFSACGSNNDNKADNNGESKIKVSVTFDAMKEFVSAVGKDKVEISTIIPAGTEPHDFEPKAQDLAGLSTASVFVYSGLGMEAWTEEAIKAADNAKLIAVEASKGADAIKNTDPEEIEEHGQYDPHIWLSLKGAELQVKNIKDALVNEDPSNKDYYEKNCNDFISQLEKLYDEYNEKFQSANKKSFVAGHAAFGYLCRDFGLEQNSVEDTFAEGEPSAQQLTELVEYCRENKVTTIFAEEMASPDVSKTLANEVGAKVETIYTIESSENDMTYLDRMTDNLSKIYDSLK